MNDSSAAPKELWSLIDAALDGSITSQQASDLQSLLENDRQICSVYGQCARIEAELYLLVRGRVASEAVCRQICCRSTTGGSQTTTATGPTSPTFSFLSTTLPGTVGWFSSGWPVAYLIATVIFSIGILVGAFTHVSPPGQVAATRSDMPSPLDEPLVRSVGQVTAMADCQWIKGSAPLLVKDVVPVGRKIKLESGLMEITYDSGAKVILQGPVTYEVESASGGFLSVGKLTARLEKRGGERGERGEALGHRSPSPQSSIPNPSLSTFHSPLFTIKTPTATVTDLGTEFGVEVDRSGTTETNVLVGAVQVARMGGKDAVDQHASVVRAGQFVRVAANGNTPVSVGQRQLDTMARRFVRAMPIETPSADAYAELVLSMKPVAYYRMERPKDKKDGLFVFDSAPGGHHGRLHPGCDVDGWLKHIWRPGRFGDAVHLYGRDIADYVEVRDFPNDDLDQVSVSAWVYATRVTDSWPLIVNEETYWRNEKPGRAGEWRFCLGLYGEGGDLMAGVAQRDRTPIRAYERLPFPINRWQHVALVADGKMLRLYRNGIEVAEVPYNGINRVPPLKRLLIGCQNVANASEPPEVVSPKCLWPGGIDELAIFYHALSAEQVRQLCGGRGKEVDGP